ncbi:beta-ketoacyl-[acyl-carrier-protein] synthase family protein [Gorillibacterium massiliense]|uniref:beta-ketoacyl-[acyl-carrier-protein] synthase family protein n=1 Tax=Gorillibacterium massiliense TaxID=1280390 RepID=UPI0004B0FDDF|nr:beta-ketoacyl-[acyl-carrier-protein] synthase family protein [Gorillibacterium massiliense]
MKRRIAITGLGVLSPVGSRIDVFWDALCQGKVGTGPIESFDTSIFEVHNGGEVKDIDPADFFSVLNPEQYGRTTQLAVAAAKMAAADAGWEDLAYPAERIGVCFGTTMGNASVIEDDHNFWLREQRGAPAELIRHYPESCIPAAVSEELGIEGPSLMVPTACAAGNYAISWGSDLLQEGILDAVLVGGTDALSRACYTTFFRLGAISPDVCKPFDQDRQGTMVSEGAACLVLEDYEKAAARGATIYAEFLGYGLSCDAYHPTAPHFEGEGAVLAIERALDSANLPREDVSYVSAHGTGTKANDLTESIALRRVFGENADRIPVSSIKSMLGHSMGAASAIEAVASSLAVHHNRIPPTVNIGTLDSDCVRDVVPDQARELPVRVVLSNSFAFGGNVSVILLGRSES